MTRSNTLPTMLRREVPLYLLSLYIIARSCFCINFFYGNGLGVPRVLRYSSFLPALANDFVQW